MPDGDFDLNIPGARLSGSARGVSERAVLILGLSAIGGFCVTAIVITLLNQAALARGRFANRPYGLWPAWVFASAGTSGLVVRPAGCTRSLVR